MKDFRKIKGQSLIEYLVVLSALLIACLGVDVVFDILVAYNGNQSNSLRANF